MNTQVTQAKSYSAASITRAAAASLVEAARKAADKIGVEVAIAVTDGAGNLKLFERTDGASFLTTEVATGKAWTASAYGIATNVWNAYLTSDPKVAQLAHVPRLVAVGGGYPTKESGKLVGGIGVSGGTYQLGHDIAETAFRALGFELPA